MLILGTYWFCKGGYSAHIPKAIEAGFNEIDIATWYGITKSVGRAIRGENVRVNSKVWATEYPLICAKVEEQYSLIGGALNTMSLHWAKRTKADYEAFAKLNHMKREGWIKRVGLCNVTIEMIEAFEENTGFLVDMVQNESHLGHIDNKTLNFCKSRGIEYQGWGPTYGLNNQLIAKFNIETQVRISLAYLILKGIRPVVFSTNFEHLSSNISVLDWIQNWSEDEKQNFIERYSRMDNDKFGFSGRYPEQYISNGIKRPPLCEFKEDK